MTVGSTQLSGSPQPGAAPRERAFDGVQLAADIKRWGRELGFAAVGIADLDLRESSERLAAWLAGGQHGDMAYMAHHAPLRADPTQLLPGACRAIVARMDYRPRDDGAAQSDPQCVLRDLDRGPH